MDQQYWHSAWAKSDKPGWQQDSVNAVLEQHWVADGSRVFVPLCGRSPDLEWLREQGHTVIGVELSESAVVRFFNERALEYSKRDSDGFTLYSAESYRIYVGDYFALGASALVGVERVYDRAALVAMSAELRPKYVAHLLNIVPGDAQLLIVLLEYDQSLMKGPPFSVPESSFRQDFEHRYRIELIHQTEADFSRRGVDYCREKAYRLTCKNA